MAGAAPHDAAKDDEWNAIPKGGTLPGDETWTSA